MDIQAVAVDSAEGFHREFGRAMAEKGPRLIEAAIAQNLQPVVDLILAQQRRGQAPAGTAPDQSIYSGL
jgi:thiamine pyrophosphate-dependent acetolactate synthase large subunit-like protein